MNHLSAFADGQKTKKFVPRVPATTLHPVRFWDRDTPYQNRRWGIRGELGKRGIRARRIAGKLPHRQVCVKLYSIMRKEDRCTGE